MENPQVTEAFLIELQSIGLQPTKDYSFIYLEYPFDKVIQKSVSELFNKYIGFWRSIAIEVKHSKNPDITRYQIGLHLMVGEDIDQEQLEDMVNDVSERILIPVLDQDPVHEYDLLYIRHPNEKAHANQIKFLETLSDSDKSEHAQLFRFGNAAMHYYQNTEPTKYDYEHWLSGLPENFKKAMIAKGYQECKSILALQRHALERRDVGMDEFIRTILNDEDFKAWQDNSK